jgi:transposase
MAAVEPAIIPKSIVSPSLLSCIITQKYEDHLPYYRQEKQFQRIKVSISRQDMSNWQRQGYDRIKPLMELMNEALKSGPVMQMDETEVQVMGEMTGKEKRDDILKSRMWLARGGPPGKPVVIYQYRQTRAASHAKEILGGFSGYLQTDGYPGYDTAVEGNSGIKHVGCFAHARRKFFEAAGAAKESANSGAAEEGINHIKKLYVIEGKLRKRYEGKGEDGEEQKNKRMKMFARVRQLCTWRVLKGFKEWLMEQKEECLPSSLIGKAIAYNLGQWDKLTRYLESPYLTPDNNACENAIRPFVIGRNNWMFNKSPEGAESSCGMHSLIQTAKANGIEPSRYLTALFEKAPLASSRADWENLLPWNIFKP